MSRELIIPKHYFSSLTSWLKANYTSQGFKKLNGLKFTVWHESGKCDITWLDDYNFICHQTSGVFGDCFYMNEAPSVATDVSLLLDYRFKSESDAKTWFAKVQNIKIGSANDLLPDVMDKIMYGNHVFVLFKGTVQPGGSSILIDLNGTYAPSSTECPYIQGRMFTKEN